MLTLADMASRHILHKDLLAFSLCHFCMAAGILVLGTALYYCYPTLANRVLLITYLASGLITWCIGNPESTHIGASALVYGLNLFLIASGFIRGNRMLIVISLIMVFLYGSFIWGMIPSLAIPQNISWEGHLSGAIIGVLLAVFLRKEGPQKEVYHWEDEEDNEEEINDDNSNVATGSMSEKPYWDVPTPSNDDLTVREIIEHLLGDILLPFSVGMCPFFVDVIQINTIYSIMTGNGMCRLYE